MEAERGGKGGGTAAIVTVPSVGGKGGGDPWWRQPWGWSASLTCHAAVRGGRPRRVGCQLKLQPGLDEPYGVGEHDCGAARRHRARHVRCRPQLHRLPSRRRSSPHSSLGLEPLVEEKVQSPREPGACHAGHDTLVKATNALLLENEPGSVDNALVPLVGISCSCIAKGYVLHLQPDLDEVNRVESSRRRNSAGEARQKSRVGHRGSSTRSGNQTLEVSEQAHANGPAVGSEAAASGRLQTRLRANAPRFAGERSNRLQQGQAGSRSDECATTKVHSWCAVRLRWCVCGCPAPRSAGATRKLPRKSPGWQSHAKWHTQTRLRLQLKLPSCGRGPVHVQPLQGWAQTVLATTGP